MPSTSRTPREEPQRRDVNINLRAPAPVRELIDRAARLVGKSRSEFMLDSARRSAEDVLLDQRYFLLDDKRHAALMGILAAPAKPPAELKKLLARKSPWER
jgi:uncharacterized protein (DUF1778 family)